MSCGKLWFLHQRQRDIGERTKGEQGQGLPLMLTRHAPVCYDEIGSIFRTVCGQRRGRQMPVSPRPSSPCEKGSCARTRLSATAGALRRRDIAPIHEPQDGVDILVAAGGGQVAGNGADADDAQVMAISTPG